MRVEYADLGAVVANYADARNADAVVDAILLGGGWAAILSNGTLLWGFRFPFGQGKEHRILTWKRFGSARGIPRCAGPL
mgnify:CR=1 FL=1